MIVQTLYSLENIIREGNNETPKKRQGERWEEKVKERDERKSAKKKERTIERKKGIKGKKKIQASDKQKQLKKQFYFNLANKQNLSRYYSNFMINWS